MVDLPPTLHGRLYLLSFDRERHRFEENRGVFALALRAAMLTDLYLTGHVAAEKGWPCVCNEGRPDDPVLSTVYDQVGAAGWLPCTPRRVLGMVRPTSSRDLRRESGARPGRPGDGGAPQCHRRPVGPPAAARRRPAWRPGADADGFQLQGGRAAPAEAARNRLLRVLRSWRFTR